MASGDELIVEFTVKDLFQRLEGKLDEIKASLQLKADRNELEKLENKVSDLEKENFAKARVEDVEGLNKSRKSQWIAIVVSTLIAISGIVVEVLKH